MSVPKCQYTDTPLSVPSFKMAGILHASIEQVPDETTQCSHDQYKSGVTNATTQDLFS
jgi:hypothetical protein